jgi:branched-chain amino acid aminotransferase
MTIAFETQLSSNRLGDAERAAILANPGFGQYETDHMITISWERETGWGDGRLTPYGPITLSPAAAVLHYAQEIFEGLKAYRHPDGSIWTFRPEANAERLNSSAVRMALPELPVETFTESLRRLVEVDQAWVPEHDGSEKSLYLRPFMFATDAFLGLRPSDKVDYMLIASPAAPIFTTGPKPVRLWLSTNYARAGAGGTGAAKCGGNYASALRGQIEGAERGCDQAVFLDSSTHEFIEELGGMNIFFVTKDGKLVTPELTGTILPGITRMSILELAKEFDLEPEERRIPVQEWKDGAANGDITEVFACGTAAIVAPVAELVWDGGEAPSTAGELGGEVTRGIRRRLLDIQQGRAEDTHGWMHRLV